jgi:hypothetical protein
MHLHLAQIVRLADFPQFNQRHAGKLASENYPHNDNP